LPVLFINKPTDPPTANPPVVSTKEIPILSKDSWKEVARIKDKDGLEIQLKM